MDLKNQGVAIYLADNLILLKASQSYIDFLEEPYNHRENIIGKPTYKFAPNFFGNSWSEMASEVIRTGEPCKSEKKEFYGFSRGITYWDTLVMPISENGKVKFIIHTTIDITSQVRKDEKFEKQNELIKWQADLMDISREAIIAWNISGEIIYWNKGAERTYGYTNEEAIGRMCHDLLKTKSATEQMDFIARLIKQGECCGEIEQTRKDGTSVFLYTTKQLIKGKDNSFIVLETNRDVTDRKTQQDLILKLQKEKNAALKYAIEMKDEFLSMITHELKTPIAVINSVIQTMELLCRNELSGKSMGYLNKIKQNSNRQLKLVNNLLDIARVSKGFSTVHKRNVDIVSVTQLVTDSINVYAQQNKIDLSFLSTLKQKVIGLDVDKYERVLLNLLSNAIKFTPAGKSINVRLSLKNMNGRSMVCIQVKDRGIGIPGDMLDVIFEKFGQVDSSLTRQAEGTGIGLYLVKVLVDLMEGHISVESRVGKGSTFCVYLPARKEKEKSEILSPRDIADNRLIKAAEIEFSDIVRA
jgi:PAS domain S-box-containing protein